MKKTALVIMAAGLGSRFGKGIKQLAKVGPAGEIIMEYSIHDALEAGFNKVVFIIRKDIEKEFKEIIGDKIETDHRGSLCIPGSERSAGRVYLPGRQNKALGNRASCFGGKRGSPGPFSGDQMPMIIMEKKLLARSMTIWWKKKKREKRWISVWQASFWRIL